MAESYPLDDINRKISVEIGWLEIMTGQGEIVTNDDTFYDDLINEIRDRKSSISESGD